MPTYSYLYRLNVIGGKAIRRLLIEYRLVLWSLSKRFRKTLTASTKQGVFTVSTSDEIIGRCLYCWREYDLEEVTEPIEFLRSIGKIPASGGTLLDIGANNGITSITALRLADLERSVAIEPSPLNLPLLRSNLAQNGLTERVTVFPYALSDKNGEVAFHLNADNFGDNRVSGSDGLRVPARRLDDLGLAQPAIIWLDVQGYEGYVFNGGRKVFSTGVPVVCEIWPKGILESGMGVEQFCNIASELWPSYWLRRKRFVKYPISMLPMLFEELGPDGDYQNVIFVS